jgi:hypothetical protein
VLVLCCLVLCCLVLCCLVLVLVLWIILDSQVAGSAKADIEALPSHAGPLKTAEALGSGLPGR